ncbi:hypothetical protein ATANTOWER_010977 [Ataeniobius toweri]|uniref:Uncharacterized protein n=1 Tax=Ataeniobius toweri TaxID=208326 RepID=A0ABU7BDB7_9TELE|nr:hypothetical protein [Ataeniobius toweri]
MLTKESRDTGAAAPVTYCTEMQQQQQRGMRAASIYSAPHESLCGGNAKEGRLIFISAIMIIIIPAEVVEEQEELRHDCHPPPTACGSYYIYVMSIFCLRGLVREDA